jgi:hypothetical protein
VSSLIDRRRFPRIRVAHDSRLPSNMLDISLGGFSMELADCLPSNTVQELHLAVADGEVMVLQARVAHARQETREDGRSMYITGLQFLADVTAHLRIVEPRFAPGNDPGRRASRGASAGMGASSA